MSRARWPTNGKAKKTKTTWLKTWKRQSILEKETASIQRGSKVAQAEL
jgi:hypothetical protein